MNDLSDGTPAARPEQQAVDRIAPADLHQRLLDEYAAPSLVATDGYRVVHMSARVGRYLRVMGGEPSADLLQLARPELRKELQRALHEAVRRRACVQTPSVPIALDGVGRAVSITVRPVLRDGDPVRGCFLILFEESDPDARPDRGMQLAERRSAEREVRQSEERLRLLIDSVLDYAIFTMASDGTIDSWNPGAERMFGYRGDEVLGEPMDLLFTPEDRAAGIPALELDRAARDGRAPDERYHLRKSGERFYCSGVTTRLDPAGGLGFAKIARDLTAQRQVAEALKEAHASLEHGVEERTRALQMEILERAAAQDRATELLRKLVTSQEDERARIARDLHDQIGQQLTALRLTLERTAEDRRSDQQLARAIELARNIDSELGFIAWELRPAVLDDLGLAAALPRFVQDWSAHYGIGAEYRAAGFETGHLPREAEVAFYRIAQEALNNVSKHAQASRVDVMLESRDRSVILVIEDNGVGFDVSTTRTGDHGIGLIGMFERAALAGAALQIESVPGDGTSVFLRRPVDRQAATARKP